MFENEPSYCFANNNFDIGLKVWQANRGMQSVFNEYETVTYLCQHFSKTEDHCSQAIKQVTKEAFENTMHHNNTTNTIAKAYLSNRECERVYHILPELKLRKIFQLCILELYKSPSEKSPSITF